VQQRKAVLVLRKIEQAAMRALDLLDPVVGRGVLGGDARPGDRKAGGRGCAEHLAEKTSTVGRWF
jgi:hypothetical protein